MNITKNHKLKSLIEIGCISTDTPEERLKKSIMTIMVIPYSLAGIIWGVYFMLSANVISGLIPLFYGIFSLVSFFYFIYTKRYNLFRFSQVLFTLVLPFFLQLTLGGFSQSSGMIIWSCNAPFIALLFYDINFAKKWFFALIILFLLACFLDESARYYFPKDFDVNNIVVLYGANFISVASLIFSIQLYFILGQKKIKIQLEERTIELSNSENKLKKSLVKEKELGKLKTSFVSTASHQFRTPLAVIQSNTELLEMLINSDIKQEPEKYKEITTRIEASISKMTSLMDDVLMHGKVISGNIIYNPKKTDLVNFCEEITKEFNSVQSDGRIIDFVAEGEPYKLQLDPKLLNHSLSNLISNAFKYSKGKNNPELRIYFASKQVVLSVKDYGIGIPEEERLHLFEPFFRANNVRAIKGSGLGLSIAKEYVEFNRGSITARSVLREGSCFEITFEH